MQYYTSIFQVVVLASSSRLTLALCNDLMEHLQVQRQWLSHPCRSLCMISEFIVSVGMNQCREHSSVDDQPWNESTKLLYQQLMEHLKRDV
jgi:hypothetical protein